MYLHGAKTQIKKSFLKNYYTLIQGINSINKILTIYTGLI
jgi:hypothetical protein